ncbi:phage holin family protein [Sphingosinithalassobacter portus]|uniref:phage holin family protein n=1 Tax=Stakelama portus TaxID=2676234 RepID=UPI000D6E3DA1|nr:phage holin family protein [Sphingosinithalassobacter portus]
MASIDPDDESIGTLFARLVEDGKSYGRAEFDYYRMLAAERLALARNGIIAGVVAAMLGFATLVGLIVGMIFSLSFIMPPGFATMLVIGLCGGGIYGLAIFARNRIMAALRPRDEKQP